MERGHRFGKLSSVGKWHCIPFQMLSVNLASCRTVHFVFDFSWFTDDFSSIIQENSVVVTHDPIITLSQPGKTKR